MLREEIAIRKWFWFVWKMENKAFKIAGIKNLMRKNYQVNPGVIDLEALVDDSISMSENPELIKQALGGEE